MAILLLSFEFELEVEGFAAIEAVLDLLVVGPLDSEVVEVVAFTFEDPLAAAAALLLEEALLVEALVVAAGVLFEEEEVGFGEALLSLRLGGAETT